MNYMQVTATKERNDQNVTWSPKQPDDDTTALSDNTDDATLASFKGNADGRRAHFSKVEHRKTVTIKPHHWLNMDFCNGKCKLGKQSLS